MKSPTVSDLPISPQDKLGWPWTEESQQQSEKMNTGDPWPRVTIVTPSFNQAQFLEETIRSVLLQGYPDLEYIIIDGGSTDGSVDIIKKYEPWLAFWVSEPDQGQSHAINKGWKRSTGEILAWLNSDDLYTADALSKAVEAFRVNPTASLIYSDGIVITETGKHLRDSIARPFDLITIVSDGLYILQQTTFYRRYVLETVGWLDESLQLGMDADLFIRIGLDVQSPKIYLPGIHLAKSREQPNAKTITQVERGQYEGLLLCDRVFKREIIPPALAAMRRKAYSINYFKNAVAKAQRGKGLPAIRYLLLALYSSPKYIVGRPLDSLWVLKEAMLGFVRQFIGSPVLHRKA